MKQIPFYVNSLKKKAKMRLKKERRKQRIRKEFGKGDLLGLDAFPKTLKSYRVKNSILLHNKLEF